MPHPPVAARPSRAYWAACAALLTIHALIGWFAMLFQDAWSYGLHDQQRYASVWLAFAGCWLLFGAIIMPRWLARRQQLLPWVFALQVCAFVPIWLFQGGILQAAWDQRWVGPPRWYYLSAAAWLAMQLHLWLRARRSVAGGR